MNKISRFVKDESGATAIEYGLIAAAIGLMLVVTMPLVSSALKGVFGKITSSLNTAAAWS
jgi:pilus assembly protein Flp/PilA